MLLYLDFRSYFEATGPNCFNVFWKVLLQSIFLARIISCRPKQAEKSVSWSVVATSLLGNLGYQTKRKKDLSQKQIAAVQPAANDITLLSSIGTLS